MKNTEASTWSGETKIGLIVAQRPQTARIFELVGIDYCCGGNTLLQTAADEQDIEVPRLLNALRAVGFASSEEEHRNWQEAELDELMDHIVARHHAWLRRELPLLLETTQTVLSVHGDSHSELAELAEIVQRVRDVLIPHLDDEESRIFPAVKSLVAGSPSGDVHLLLEEMRTEHDALGEDLHRLRELTKGFAEPADACAKYREMLSGLRSLEDDMHMHVHLENNVLLPRALELVNAR